MYGINAARPSSLAARNAVATRSVPAIATSATGPLHDLRQVLVASAGETEHVIPVVAPAVLQEPGDCVRGLQRRDDPLQLAELGECRERLRVGDGEVAGPARVAQVGVLGADAGIVEPGRD